MAQGSNSTEKRSSVALERGLYALRYSKAGAGFPPLVSIRPAAGSERIVQIILAPGETMPKLEEPGTACVLFSEGRCTLEVVVRARGNGSVDAALNLETLQTSGSSYRRQINDASGATPASGETRLVAHVSRRGDVAARAGEWIAGPQAPAPIEGISLETEGLVECSVLVQGEPRYSNWFGDRTFVGTKGRARPLAGIRFRIRDEADRDGTLRISALFLGSSVIEREGRSVEVRSAAGNDPLVGLKLELFARTDSAFVPAPSPSIDRKSRVRVFRAGVELRRD